MSTRIQRLDYQPAPYLVEWIEIGIDLAPETTRVRTRARYQRNPQYRSHHAPDLVLDGVNLQLHALRLNGRALPRSHYQQDASHLRISHLPNSFELALENSIVPAANTELSGLYLSRQNFLTQCEAQGFRRITFFQDRPDVMTEFTVMLRANKLAYPVLLSNGNLVEQGDLGDGRHYAKWHDPFKKPSYLFALVAGQFASQQQRIRLLNGRSALLEIYAESADIDKTDYALASLQRAIEWDRTRFGLDLDLERFMIVAANDFNMGAMENKGLNIFNTRYVLCTSESATDSDFAAVEGVIGHEYFHNWTGNRVTCRDWFQLTLKEGLTVFRDQEFSADQLKTGRALQRIDDVTVLRRYQFPEDSGPMAHPIRPESYVQIDNFYTATVYEKGAEVIRMLHTLLGETTFARGLNHYLSTHDGQAVTCDDFVAAMATVSGRDLSQFMGWYSQVGTPRVTVKSDYDATHQVLRLRLTQSAACGHAHPPLHIPILCGLLDQEGRNLLPEPTGSRLLELRDSQQTFEFPQIKNRPVLSLLRNFSAPIHLEFAQSDADLLHLARYDSDYFNRWEAGQNLALRYLVAAYHASEETAVLPAPYLAYQQEVLAHSEQDASLRALLLTLPNFERLAETLTQSDPNLRLDPARLTLVWQRAQREWATPYSTQWQALYQAQHAHTQGPYRLTQQGERRLKNLALHTLFNGPASAALLAGEWALAQYHRSNNMNDRSAALAALVQYAAPQAAAALADFYARYREQDLVIDKWFALQAGAPLVSLEKIHALCAHTDFSATNPNRVRSVVHQFCLNNPRAFHRVDGAGYDFWLAQLKILDRLNPQVAARLARALDHWRKYASPYREAMLTRLQAAKNAQMTPEVDEILSAALSGG